MIPRIPGFDVIQIIKGKYTIQSRTESSNESRLSVLILVMPATKRTLSKIYSSTFFILFLFRKRERGKYKKHRIRTDSVEKPDLFIFHKMD
jgi:hypothetical protein